MSKLEPTPGSCGAGHPSSQVYIFRRRFSVSTFQRHTRKLCRVLHGCNEAELVSWDYAFMAAKCQPAGPAERAVHPCHGVMMNAWMLIFGNTWYAAGIC